MRTDAEIRLDCLRLAAGMRAVVGPTVPHSAANAIVADARAFAAFALGEERADPIAGSDGGPPARAPVPDEDWRPGKLTIVGPLSWPGDDVIPVIPRRPPPDPPSIGELHGSIG